MKSRITKLVVIIAAGIVLTNCKKMGKTYDAYFYTNIENPTGLLTLALDNKIIGDLPLIKSTLSTNNDTIITNAIHLKLSTGKYIIEVRDKQGNIKCSGFLKFRFNSFNGATHQGVLEHAMSDRIIVTRIFFE